METLRNVLAVGCGGFVGSVGRWALGLLMSALLPGLPAGTFVANVLAGLIIGIVTGAGSITPLAESLRLLLAVGLCGGLSTFSTFSNETLQLIERGSWGPALINIAANVIVCLVAVYIGTKLGALK